MQPLSYSPISGRVALKNRLAKWATFLPAWLLALVLVVLVEVINNQRLSGSIAWEIHRVTEFLNPFTSFAVLFAVGALRRMNWRHILIMLAFAGVWSVMGAAMTRQLSLAPFPYSLILGPTLLMLIVGFGEWLLTQRNSRKLLPWVSMLLIAAGCCVPLINKPLTFTGAIASIPDLGGGNTQKSWGDAIYWPLLVALTWAAIPAGFKLGREGTRAGRMFAVGLAFASVAAFCLLFTVLIYSIARRSLSGAGIFSRNYAASILETRHSDSDIQAIWQALDQADWSKPVDFGSWDDRQEYIAVLSGHDRQGTARRLSQMLRDKPSQALARFGARLFGEERRYETVPLMMRYACQGDDECTRALERMRVPQVALVLIRESSVYGRPATRATDFPIRTAYREDLKQLLGRDAGPNLSDWMAYYNSTAGRFPTPLPNTVSDETDGVWDAMRSYWAANEKLYEAKCRLFVRRLEENGYGDYLKQITAVRDRLKGQREPTPTDLAGIDPSLAERTEGLRQKAFADLTVSPPDWSVVGTEGLERQVQKYVEAVNAMIASHEPAATAPAGVRRDQ
ncbi:MAG TPA: hypothetical protein VG269_15115 [Tepidisphaeraceae bacterium]|nr:hypothetical protein [Tepidisphaeraceae bacterium]